MYKVPGDLSEINSRAMLVSVLIFGTLSWMFIFRTMQLNLGGGLRRSGFRVHSIWILHWTSSYQPPLAMGPALLPWSTTSHMYTMSSLIVAGLRVRPGRTRPCVVVLMAHGLATSSCHSSSWREHKIELPHLHQCHLLNYQSQLQSILLSHCRYSLKIGHAHEISYDLPALEKYILDRFIHGKPKILVYIPQVSYQKDFYTAATFAAVRKKVTPQVLNHITCYHITPGSSKFLYVYVQVYVTVYTKTDMAVK